MIIDDSGYDNNIMISDPYVIKFSEIVPWMWFIWFVFVLTSEIRLISVYVPFLSPIINVMLIVGNKLYYIIFSSLIIDALCRHLGVYS